MRTIYLDMDGVFAAFDKPAKSLLGRPIGWGEAVDITDAEWMWLASERPRLFAELPVCDGALEFAAMLREHYQYDEELGEVNLAYPNKVFKLEWLTAIPRNTSFKYATMDKVVWGLKNFPGIDVCIGPYSRDKMNLAGIGEILIDDRLSNLQAWAGKGGQAIYHPTGSDFKNTCLALADCVRSTFPGIWKDGKREPTAAK